ncbi:MAG: hypothetical protein NTV49_05080 [Kiritimatiellaeota bacterium]|nr:hypothetical protein [Kiritimatiellota bacterium]
MRHDALFRQDVIAHAIGFGRQTQILADQPLARRGVGLHPQRDGHRHHVLQHLPQPDGRRGDRLGQRVQGRDTEALEGADQGEDVLGQMRRVGQRDPRQHGVDHHPPDGVGFDDLLELHEAVRRQHDVGFPIPAGDEFAVFQHREGARFDRAAHGDVQRVRHDCQVLGALRGKHEPALL